MLGWRIFWLGRDVDGGFGRLHDLFTGILMLLDCSFIDVAVRLSRRA